MKKKIILSLTALSVLAFPMSSLAANNTVATQSYTCSVSDCQIDGTHEHTSTEGHGNCNESGHSRSHQNSGNTSNRSRHHQ